MIGGTKFYERAEIKDAVNYLTFLVNPADGGAFTRIANSPKRGIGQTSLSRVLAHADTMGIPPWEAAAAADDVPDARHGGRQARSAASCPRWSGCASGSRPASRSPSCWRRRCARPATSTRWRRSARSRPRAGSRTSRSSCRSRASTTPAPTPGDDVSVAEFLQQISLLADADTIRDDEGLVTLMTLHNAKGLEFPIVFMIGCEDGVFPRAARSTRGRSRRSAGSPASASPARCATSTSPTRGGATIRRPRRFGAALALPRRDPAQADGPARPQRGRRAARPGAGASPRGRRPRQRRRRRSRGGAGAVREGPAAPCSGSGERRRPRGVGDGVVAGVEPGRMVVVNFRGRGRGAQADGRSPRSAGAERRRGPPGR